MDAGTRGAVVPDGSGPDRRARLAGAVWGHLVGDALGLPYESWPRGRIGEVRRGATGTHGKPPGTWSDDGALMLALLDSLVPDPNAHPPHGGGFDPADQARRFLAWVDDGAYTPQHEGRFDIGRTTAEAMGRLRRGIPPEAAGPAGERDQGNGSLMRILPIALSAPDPQVKLPELIERAHRASRVTHGHPACQAACAVYVVAARDLLRGDPDRERVLGSAVHRLRLFYAGSGAARASPGHAQALQRLEAWTERQGRGGVLDSFWSAWDAFAGALSYRDAVERAIGYGNDTDTTAAICGGLAGLYWGREGIPRAWLAGMRDRQQVEALIERLLAFDPAAAAREEPGRPPGAPT